MRILGGLSKVILFFVLASPKADNKKQHNYHLKFKDTCQTTRLPKPVQIFQYLNSNNSIGIDKE